MKLKEPNNPNYAATIVRIDHLNKLENSDNLMGAPLLGMQAVVSKDTEVGTVGVLFVAETQLSEEYTARNNLFRHAEFNEDKQKTGFIEDNRRVKAIKLRGNRSDALFMPLSSLAYTKVDLSEFKVGDAFEELNGFEICKKFERQRKSVPIHEKNKHKVFTRVDEKMFPRHYDTSQYYRVLNTFKPYTEIIVTQKLHGCLEYSTKVLLEDGSLEKIGKLVNSNYDGYVMGVNEHGEIVPSKVTGVSKNGFSDGWLNLRTTGRSGKTNRSASKLVLTPNHRVYSPDHSSADSEGYVVAGKLASGDKVWILERSIELSPVAEQVMIGKMLGDGSITMSNSGETAKITWGHVDEEYTSYTKMSVIDYCPTKDGTIISGYGSNIHRASTSMNKGVANLFRDWVKGDSKQVPDSIVSKINPIALAFWYMDDGSLGHGPKQANRANFATNGFNEDSIDNLLAALRKFDISGVKYKSSGWRIRLNALDAEKFFILVAPYISKSMAYKLPEEYRKLAGNLPVDTPNYRSIREVEILDIEPVDPVNKVKYDLETETNNFFAGDVLVHNSLLRFSNIPVKRKLSLAEKWVSKLGVKVQKEEYAHVYGSNRVIKDANNDRQQHFYEHDIWTEAAKTFDEFVPENFIVYGELIGWTPEGTPIQKHYTYRVPERTNEFYVYRVAQINPQGILTDLSWDQVKEFCRDRGMKTVPELWRGKHEDFNPEEWLDTDYHDKLHGGYPQAVPLDKESPCDEGVCIRVDGLAPFIAKLKSPEFFAHETKMLDEEAIDMEEEGKVE